MMGVLDAGKLLNCFLFFVFLALPPSGHALRVYFTSSYILFNIFYVCFCCLLSCCCCWWVVVGWSWNCMAVFTPPGALKFSVRIESSTRMRKSTSVFTAVTVGCHADEAKPTSL